MSICWRKAVPSNRISSSLMGVHHRLNESVVRQQSQDSTYSRTVYVEDMEYNQLNDMQMSCDITVEII
uniref:Ovule protein n=1 Tax=Heterorhabditis bacteriophora TaxID=37862 RepID=A0A1I7WH12_HETBA